MDVMNKGVEAVSDFLQGNPFSTPVGQRIDQATDAALASENWALNMEICDLINETEEGPRDAVRAIRKRLQQNAGKNHTTIMYTLTVLETAVKNCGPRFHQVAMQKEFVQELVKVISPKYDPPQVVQEKVLGLIQSWADAFRKVPELNGIVEVYDELKQKGVQFPMTDLDNMAPILTPAQSVASPQRQLQQPPQQQHQQQPANQPQPQRLFQASSNVPMMAAAGPINPSPEQLGKLRGELDAVNNNLTVLREMLTELHPGKESREDFELLQELHKTCRSMQQRVVQLLNVVANEEVTSELLMVNDELNNVFMKYERYMKNRQGEGVDKSGAGQFSAASGAGAGQLIDLANNEQKEENLSAQLAGMSVVGSKNVSQIPNVSGQGQGANSAIQDEFDMFSQSRNATYAHSKQSGSTYDANLENDVMPGLSAAQNQRNEFLSSNKTPTVSDKESDFKQMEAWLHDRPVDAAAGATTAAAASGETTQEFDQFLAQRAKVGENLPSAAGSQENQTQKKEENLFDL